MNKTDLETMQKLLADKVKEAEFVLVGIGEEFNEDFKDIGKFPMLMSSLEEVDVNTTLEWTVPFLEQRFLFEHGESPIINAYKKLYELIKDKNYFIITTCIDENVKKANFDLEKLVEPCGNYQMLQCSEKCNDKLYPSKDFCDLVKQAILDGVGLDSLERPVCPVCGKPLVHNNILCESKYAESGYKPQWDKYTKWIQETLNRKLCILELGVGMNLPDIIRWPFEKIAFYNQKASFFRINQGIYQMTEELSEKGVSIGVDAVEFLNEM
jgi:NAD-dependent SIR2 family protein deacetylase